METVNSNLQMDNHDSNEDDEDDVTVRFATYEDFLDSHVTEEDLFYLEDEVMARNLVELGYRSSGAILSRTEFNRRKLEAESSNSKGEEEQQQHK